MARRRRVRADREPARVLNRPSSPRRWPSSPGDALTLQASGQRRRERLHTDQGEGDAEGHRGPDQGLQDLLQEQADHGLLRFSNEGEQVYDDPLPNGTLKLAGGGTGKQASLIPLGGKNPAAGPCSPYGGVRGLHCARRSGGVGSCWTRTGTS
jgi:hypothetical protein